MDHIVLENIWANWHIEEKLGTGAFGSVYKARRSGYGFEHDFYAAVKVIRVPADDGEIKNLLADGMSREQISGYYDSLLRGLVSEIELMDSLKGSSNIVTIEDYEVVRNPDGIGWTVYIRMELLKNLNQYRREHPFSVEDVVRLGLDMCSALEYCSRKKIVHRDIKPDNIFVNEFGEFKLGDFGIARQLEMNHVNLSQKGTSSYMAPEIYRGEAYGASVDIYSLGIVLYRLLNRGRLPFMPPYPNPITVQDTEAAMARRLNGEPMPEPMDGGRALADIVRKACMADAARRYATPTQMKMDLQGWLTHKTGVQPSPFVANNWQAQARQEDKLRRQEADRRQQEARYQQGGQYQQEAKYQQPAMRPGPVRNGGTGTSTGKSKKSGRGLKIAIGCVCGALVLAVLLFFFLPVNKYETLSSKFMYSLSDTDSRFDASMEKGDAAYEAEDYDKAVYYYMDKALEEKPKALDAWIGALKACCKNNQTAADDAWKDIKKVLTGIADLSSEPNETAQAEISKALNEYMGTFSKEMFERMTGGDLSHARKDSEEFFERFSEAEKILSGKVNLSELKAEWYMNFFDTIYVVEPKSELAQSLISDALAQLPENPELTARRDKLVDETLVTVFADIDEALAQGDFDRAYELCEQIKGVDSQKYEETLEQIRTQEGALEFMLSLKAMFEDGDYDGVARAIAGDKIYMGWPHYLVDGALLAEVESATGFIYDNNGLYYGEIYNNERYGSGTQLKFYSGGDYKLLEGNWDGNANGNCTLTWWASGVKAVVTGNFTDGYEDGNMTISWTSGGRNWTAVYTATKGQYKEIKKDENGASIYAIAYASDGSSAWWTTDQLYNNGCFIN